MTDYEILTDHCVQTGNCLEIAPTLFSAGDDGVVTSKESAESEGEQAVLKDAARSCPAQAIKLHL